MKQDKGFLKNVRHPSLAINVIQKIWAGSFHIVIRDRKFDTFTQRYVIGNWAGSFHIVINDSTGCLYYNWLVVVHSCIVDNLK